MKSSYFCKQKKNGTFAPVGEVGLFIIEHGIAYGQHVDKKMSVSELLGITNNSLRITSLR